MRYLPDGNQMKTADLYTIEEIGVPSLVLMERAALQIADTMERKQVDLTRPLIVCGSGNNGGDGFALARILKERGVCPDVLFAGKESSLTGECTIQKKAARRIGIPIFTEFPEKDYTVVIDALFGVGLSREITGSYRDVIRQMNECDADKVAVDIPSGVCSRTGQILGDAFCARLTISMQCQKVGCMLSPGRDCAGEVIPVPIGIWTGQMGKDPSLCFTYEKEDLSRLLPERPADSHKGTFGKVLLIAGSKGMAGAAALAASAAYTVGAGLIRIYTHESNRTALTQLLPEAVITGYEYYNEEELEELLQWADVACIGCGLGRGECSRQLLVHTLEKGHLPCVVDADGINLLAGCRELIFHTKCSLILTPHLLEMSRIWDQPVSALKKELVASAVQFSDQYPLICVLKDARTVVSERGRAPYVNLSGSSAMAKAGSGDVLAGVITGLLAQGCPPFESASAGVYLHGLGGQEAEKEKGSYSSLARDLIRGIQTVIQNAKE